MRPAPRRDPARGEGDARPSPRRSDRSVVLSTQLSSGLGLRRGGPGIALAPLQGTIELLELLHRIGRYGRGRRQLDARGRGRLAGPGARHLVVRGAGIAAGPVIAQQPGAALVRCVVIWVLLL